MLDRLLVLLLALDLYNIHLPPEHLSGSSGTAIHLENPREQNRFNSYPFISGGSLWWTRFLSDPSSLAIPF